MKKTIYLLIAVVMLLSVAGCSAPAQPAATAAPAPASAAPAATEAPAPKLTPVDLKIGVVMKSFDEFQNALIQGAKDEAMAQGVKEENIIVLAPKNESDVMG